MAWASSIEIGRSGSSALTTWAREGAASASASASVSPAQTIGALRRPILALTDSFRGQSPAASELTRPAVAILSRESGGRVGNQRVEQLSPQLRDRVQLSGNLREAGLHRRRAHMVGSGFQRR